MGLIRLRHAKGISTIQVELNDSFTVQDFQHEISMVTEILPSLQDLKSGYPPRSLTIIPELPFSSLGLKSGEQVIVGQKQGGPSPNAPSSKAAANLPTTSAPPPSSFSAPLPASSFRPKAASSALVHVPVGTDGSVLVHRIVPDDNSCLFSSVALVFEQDITKAPQMRKLVADGIQNDPAKYNEAILGYPSSQYVSKILQPATWGGAIELAILASHYNTEIASIDVETGRIDHFSPGAGEAGMRCLLIYSGIHYDAATLAPDVNAPAEWHQTIFPIRTSSDDSDSILVAAKKLAGILREKKAFTNTATFDLKCEDCGQGLKGEKGAREHAEKTGHVRFGEY